MTVFNTLMRWNSRYSIEILEEVAIELRLCRGSIRANLEILKVIFRSLYVFATRLKI